VQAELRTCYCIALCDWCKALDAHWSTLSPTLPRRATLASAWQTGRTPGYL
jgi:hypothetical protein